MITIKNITKVYDPDGGKTVALAGVSFTIKRGEFVSVMGPSGSGKSTLLHILSFLDRSTNGDYAFNNKDITSLSDEALAHIRNTSVGFIFQSFNLLGRSSVYENVEMPLLYSSVAPHDWKKRVEHAVAAVGLSEKLLVEAARLSGGQKQRVAIARALVNNPDIIFADEPTGNLDSQSGAQIMEILKTLHKDGHTIIMVTHETYTAGFAKRLIRIKDGRIESDGPIAHESDVKKYFK